MRRCAIRSPTSCNDVVRTVLFALCTSQRTAVSIGGRGTRLGFSQPQGKAPRVKQGTSRDVAQRIPGTTKVRYTNNKGRTFTFSIPVSQLTHPQVNRRGASAAGWQEIDTSFSDVGDLEDDMPTEVDERLAAAGVTSSSREEGEGVVVEVDAEQLRGLQEAFVQLCKDYVLMDTSGMTTSMTYNELNNGPDYEHYDRKTRRRRHWLALRHRFEDVRELLWPTDAAAEMRDRGTSEEEGEETSAPLLPLSSMMEALSWLEAASTFAIRKHRPYDTAAATEFAPLDLSREVRVIAECIRVVGFAELMASEAQHRGEEKKTTTTMSSAVASSEQGDVSGDDAKRRATVDCFISFASLCTNHKVPLSVAFSSPSPSHLSSNVKSSDGGETNNNKRYNNILAAQAWLSTLPALTRVKDSIRVMAVLQSLAEESDDAIPGNASPLLCFSNIRGEVVNADILGVLCRLVSVSLFPHIAALENVDEGELCVLMHFVAELHEQNAAFLQTPSINSDSSADVHAHERQVLLHVTQLVLARCRQLLYKTNGPTASLLSGDEENIPLVDLQTFAEHNHPAVRVHTKIGQVNAQGLRYARLQTPASATLAHLLHRIEQANSQLTTRTHTLRADLLQHISHKAALGKARLTLEDVARALSLLADAMRQTSEQQVKAKFDRLFAALSTSIGVGLQQPQSTTTVLNLLEGFARCHYIPSSYKLLEMVTLRMMMHGDFSLGEAARALLAMLQVAGTHNVSQAMQQAIAMRLVTEIEKCDGASSTAGVTINLPEVWSVLRALRFSFYPSFASLMLLASKSPLTTEVSGWTPCDHVRYAVLLTAAAGELMPAAEDAEVLLSLSNTARKELQLGLRAGVDAFSSVSEEEKEDAYQECLVTCAALQLDVAPPALAMWAHTSLGEGEQQQKRRLHSLCTPLLATGTLEAMEALHLAPSAWYAAYDAFLAQALQLVLNEKARAEAPPYRLLDDDAQTAERMMYLASLSPAARVAATALLEREVERLDAVLASGSATDTATSALGRVDTQPVFSFQQKALNHQTETAALEEQLVRYCVALKQQVGQGATADATTP